MSPFLVIVYVVIALGLAYATFEGVRQRRYGRLLYLYTLTALIVGGITLGEFVSHDWGFVAFGAIAVCIGVDLVQMARERLTASS